MDIQNLINDNISILKFRLKSKFHKHLHEEFILKNILHIQSYMLQKEESGRSRDFGGKLMVEMVFLEGAIWFLGSQIKIP